MTRQEALEIVKQYVKNINLRRHMFAVEAAMAAYAEKFGEDEQRYRVAGLLHDFDWEIHPTLKEHPQEGAKILREKGVDEEMIQTILSHADHTGIARTKRIDKALAACDEITGLIVAVTLVRPSKKLSDVTLESVQKKWKTKEFARGVNREDIEKSAADLGVDVWDHVQTVLDAMKSIAGEIGL
ncbi:MAG: HAD family hydrolase [Candidatus Chisholmbacteria bacterium RIFCSPHIGHO2_12_FULL_49_9]|uniref:HAD family hydrolase n=1 Tax=Candidatus Chisholmbacteria bacterium RIFCSPHIGHO2_01_FULL_52_32 TaxID=1797591 RepID=A0A1G1VTE8_9BACT|nr:MAG: HAD family hydrolase [Candidatus Chisholmbacteria bacterium RIFCSPHIGHO2_01_FULL_52_32]OGY19955.1 MAG: HAD family hydrolase [Candidatus Chisholmbacteria bacterium RIFCSPLOWO2_01_FULL_50_28]OGY20814.1 MAG: HAD family hydrolase [Candidatus Chisholmbacteria bacterium RIFCSPHIGHO2_12_FULL_49_9]